jgi:hypothetical protein
MMEDNSGFTLSGNSCKKSARYRGVYNTVLKNRSYWVCKFTVRGKNLQCYFDDERSAAIQYDKWRIEAGKAPVNILKRA